MTTKTHLVIAQSFADARYYMGKMVSSKKWTKCIFSEMIGFDKDGNKYLLFWLDNNPDKLLSLEPSSIIFTRFFYESNKSIIDLILVAVKRLIRHNPSLSEVLISD